MKKRLEAYQPRNLSSVERCLMADLVILTATCPKIMQDPSDQSAESTISCHVYAYSLMSTSIVKGITIKRYSDISSAKIAFRSLEERSGFMLKPHISMDVNYPFNFRTGYERLTFPRGRRVNLVGNFSLHDIFWPDRFYQPILIPF